MDQELLMKQIVEQVMAAMKNGTPASAPAAASSCGSKVTAANYPLANRLPTGNIHIESVGRRVWSDSYININSRCSLWNTGC